MQSFEKLSYRGKARRLRQLAMNALLRYPMEVASVHLIEAFTNANYRVKTRDGNSYFIRVCEPGWRTDMDLTSEVVFLQALSRDGNFNTPLPIAAETGDYLEDTCWGFPVQDIATAFRDLMNDTAQDAYPALRAADPGLSNIPTR